MTESEILLRINELQDQATAASRECIHYMGVETADMKKYLAALKIHVEATKEINRLKKMLDEAQS